MIVIFKFRFFLQQKRRYMSLVGGPAFGDYGHWINELLKEQIEFVVLRDVAKKK